MALLDTYKPMREYIIKYLDSKTSFYNEVVIFKVLNHIKINIKSESSSMPFVYLMDRLKELKIDFWVEPFYHGEDITLTEDEYLKLYTLCSLQNKF